MVQSKKYYKSRTVGVTSQVGLTTDRDLVEPSVLKKHDVFYTSTIPEVTWYEPLYNTISSPSISILSSVSALIILQDYIMVGLPNLFHVCKFTVKSEPEPGNFTLLFNIFTNRNFLLLASTSSYDVVFFMQRLVLFLARQCELLCPTILISAFVPLTVFSNLL